MAALTEFQESSFNRAPIIILFDREFFLISLDGILKKIWILNAHWQQLSVRQFRKLQTFETDQPDYEKQQSSLMLFVGNALYFVSMHWSGK